MTSGGDKRLRVMIVDDHRELLDSLSFALPTIAAIDVIAVESAAEALRGIMEHRPDCIIIDVKMPQIDGLQLVRVLRGDPETADIPMVILSAFVQERDQSAGMLAGADQYLTKPSKPQTIVEAIMTAVRLSQQERDARLHGLAEDVE
ncbi:MAG TPA: response regulator [Ktedonobacterales bacterium]